MVGNNFPHPSAQQLEWPLHDSRQCAGDTSHKHLKGKMARTFLSQELGDLLSVRLEDSSLIHLLGVYWWMSDFFCLPVYS